MKVVDLSKAVREDGGIMAFGFFDAIHVGHRQVIEAARRLASQNATISSVFLFRNNIFPLIGIDKHPIFTFEERLSFISDLGVDTLYFIDADKAFLSLSPAEFISYLKSKLTLKGFTCGADFTFGEKGAGGVNDLVEGIGGKHYICDLVTIHGEKVSSERIKAALSCGDLDLVESCLDRMFSLKRTVISGRKDGIRMGFPTINCDLLSVGLLEGVYFTEITVGEDRYKAVTNVGAHPTFEDNTRNIESYLLDYSGDLYESEVEITFLKYHRTILRFSSVSELAARIAEDVKERRHYD